MAKVYPKIFFEGSNKKVNKASCFVLMPFNPKFKEVYHLIKETLQSKELNIICNRADDFHEPHIIETILKQIQKSEFIIADLTDANSNVFYELGLAHCVKPMEKVIVLTQNMDFVPFDLRQFRCIVYEQTISGSKALKKKLLETFKESSKSTFRFSIQENQNFTFGQKLIGNENYLYELSFECPHIGYDAAKLIVHFKKCSVNEPTIELNNQNMVLSVDQPRKNLENIPWTINLNRTENGTGVFSIEKR